MTAKKLFSGVLFFMCQVVLAQQDSIVLKEVLISDYQLQHFSDSQSVLRINDSVIRKNQPALTSLLNYNSTVFFKENGLGMVSSPSFRGTTAQQTAVIWNGININSQLNGQTDFNTVTTRDYESISVRPGGGSAIYGSSAIGGSIHLNNELRFQNGFHNELFLNFGSFNTVGGNYKLSASNDKFSVNASVSRNDSDNDYDYLQTNGKNLNGQYYNTSLNASAGYKINNNNFLKIYSQLFESQRHFSLVFPSDSKTKYRDYNTRNLLEWDVFSGHFISKVKLAALSESYQYFPNIESGSNTFGKVETYIGKYDLAWNATENILLNAVLDYSKSKAHGSDIEGKEREIASGVLLFKHQPSRKFGYELTARKEFTDNYKSPLLFSIGSNYRFSKFYALKINGSRNFRIPTFNDLYWQPGGNMDLKPESSYQGEIGNAFSFRNVKLSLTGYYMDIDDMIRWIPTGSFWSPVNTDKVIAYGGEAVASWKKDFNGNAIGLNATYAYTVSENDATKKQLIYVPYHKATAAISYYRKRFSVDYQCLFTGEVFLRSDNNPQYKLDSYFVNNVMAAYDFGKANSYKIGFQVLNLWNEKYQSVESRYLPGRNFNMYINLNF